jgi:hypothetical protein
MPAKRTSRAGERRAVQETEANPFDVDLSEVPMTPAMVALHEVAKLRYLAAQAEAFLDDLVIDGSQLTLAEGQLMQNVMLAQGRPFTWRAQLKKIFERRRGIDLAVRDWRQRAAGSIGLGEHQKPPAYLSDETLQGLRKCIEPLTEAVAVVKEQRKKQFPALNRRTKAVIESPAVEAKAS